MICGITWKEFATSFKSLCSTAKNTTIFLTESYLQPLLVNERGIEPIVIKKANQFVSFKFGDVQLLDVLNFRSGTTRLDIFLKASKTSKAKGCFSYEWFDEPEKLNNIRIPPYETFFSKLRNNNHLKKDYSDCQRRIDGGLTSEEVFLKMKNKQSPATGQENYQNLTSVR